MKKVKIYLGIACMAVVIAGVATTKANAKFTNPEYFFSAVTGTCQLMPFETGCIVSDANDCRADINANEVNRPVYDENISGVCVTPLSRQ